MNHLCGLEQMESVIALATSLYYARVLHYRLELPLWKGLTASEQHTYVTLAEQILEALKPVGEVEPPTLFQQAATLARTEAARVIRFRRDGNAS